jgi:hypothetical protein
VIATLGLPETKIAAYFNKPGLRLLSSVGFVDIGNLSSYCDHWSNIGVTVYRLSEEGTFFTATVLATFPVFPSRNEGTCISVWWGQQFSL